MVALIISLLFFQLPVDRCISVNSTETFQIYIDLDGNQNTGPYNGFDLVVRGGEQLDSRNFWIREASDGAGPGGWGPPVFLAQGITTPTGWRINMPAIGSAAKVVIETYDQNGVRTSATARISPVGGCPNNCSLGDFNGDCAVDLLDYAIFLENFNP